jgi:signal transduction histidine kinase
MHLIHDLRNLLTVGAGLVDNLRASNRAEGRTVAALEQLSRCFDSMFEVVDDLLPSTDTVMMGDTIELNQLVLERVAMFRAALKKDVELQIRPLRGLMRVRARAIDLERILLNLILNAAEAMVDGGVITVETDILPSCERDAQAQHPTSPRTVRLTVSDSGIAMSPQWQEAKEKIDVSTNRMLGLASVRLVVLRLGGRVYVESGAETGTVVHIDLPEAPPLA